MTNPGRFGDAVWWGWVGRCVLLFLWQLVWVHWQPPCQHCWWCAKHGTAHRQSSQGTHKLTCPPVLRQDHTCITPHQCLHWLVLNTLGLLPVIWSARQRNNNRWVGPLFKSEAEIMESHKCLTSRENIALHAGLLSGPSCFSCVILSM